MARLVYDSDEIPCWLVSDVLVFVALHSGSPTDAAWDGYVNVTRGLIENLGGLLVVAGNTSITARQRGSLRSIYADANVPIAVLTESLGARGILTAIRWFGIAISGFKMDDYSGALEWLGRGELAEIVCAHAQEVLEGARRHAR
jgi:hypothetical protein